MENPKISLVALVACFLFSMAISAQTRSVVPPAEDIEVYYSFFNFHNDFAKWLEKRKTEVPQRAEKLNKAAVDRLKIKDSELGLVTAVSATVTSDLDKLAKEVDNFVEKAKVDKKPPDRASLLAFENRRRQIVLQGVDSLKRSLSPAGWNGLHSHINDEHRLSIRRMVPVAPPRATTAAKVDRPQQ